MNFLKNNTWLIGAVATLLLNVPAAKASALSFVVYSTDGDPNYINSLPVGQTPDVDAGFYTGGSVLQISATGTQNSNTSNNFFTDANGALSQPTALFDYANVGATNYPVVAGGNGTNYYVGGGTNYNTGANLFAFAGVASTDTTNPATIRFGALVGTFSANPVENRDWFFIGTNNLITIPLGGDELYLAVNDDPGKNYNNGGFFNVTVTPVPEPSSAPLLVISLLSACLLARKVNETRA